MPNHTAIFGCKKDMMVDIHDGVCELSCVQSATQTGIHKHGWWQYLLRL